MRITTIVIRNARPITEPHPDPSEELAIELVAVRDIPTLIATGHIDHAVCVAGLLWWLTLGGPGQTGDPTTQSIYPLST